MVCPIVHQVCTPLRDVVRHHSSTRVGDQKSLVLELCADPNGSCSAAAYSQDLIHVDENGESYDYSCCFY